MLNKSDSLHFFFNKGNGKAGVNMRNINTMKMRSAIRYWYRKVEASNKLPSFWFGILNRKCLRMEVRGREKRREEGAREGWGEGRRDTRTHTHVHACMGHTVEMTNVRRLQDNTWSTEAGLSAPSSGVGGGLEVCIWGQVCG